MCRHRNEYVITSSTSLWPEHGLESVSRCPACGFKKSSLIHAGLVDRIFFCAPGQWSMYQCENCHSAHLNPRPSLETIHLAYKKYYTHEVSLKKVVIKPRFSQRFRRFLITGYQNYRYRTSREPASIMALIMMHLLPQYRAKYIDSMRFLPRAWPGATLLDIGFGSGKFLFEARNTGWTVAGVDPDPIAVKNAKKLDLDVRQGGLEVYADHIDCFDFISLNSVIEHVHNPHETLKLAFKLLKPGGSIYIKTPNIDAIGHREFREHWRGLEPPRHLTIFTWQGLESLLSNTGFVRIERRYRINAYPTLASKSRAISQGKDPYTSKTTMRDHLMGMLARIKSHLNIRNSEIIVLMANKPHTKRY